jgi:hypothetical protein
MGIDRHALNFLIYSSKKRSFGRVATIGRQHLMVPKLRVEFGDFCEEFFKQRLEATVVDSYDLSGYEGATHLIDFNQPLAIETQYDTVVDCGCIEHIYNVPQALKNASLLCAASGQIIHVLPANNFCGHGFWQFSPELFFSLYSETNGYCETEVFLADLARTHYWFEVVPPAGGHRAEVISRSQLYVLCRTRKKSDFSQADVQQSDYVHTWQADRRNEAGPSGLTGRVKRMLKTNAWVHRFGLSARGTIRAVGRGLSSPNRLSNGNPNLRRRAVVELLQN